MKNTLKLNRIRLLTDLLVKNAALLGLSDLTLQNMIETALESNPGMKIRTLVPAGADEGQGKCKHFSQMPHHPLPNVIEYTRKQSRFDPISALFGILRREDTGRQEVSNYENIEANNYVKYHMNFLGHMRDKGNSHRYWKVALSLLNSKAFQLMALNYVCSNWHRDMTENEVNKILGEVSNIVTNMSTEIKLRRVYIPKANKKIRPLGVPSKAWRVYLHMVNVLIVWYRTGTDRRQHAYFPGRGVHTAWKALLKQIDEPNIYEFDLTSFFPSVSLKANEKIMREVYKIPPKVTEWINLLTRSLTLLTEKDEIDESRDRHVLLTSDGKPNPNLSPEIQRILRSLLENLTESRKQWLITSAAFKEILPQGWTVYKEIGVPQGAAISCGLSTLNLNELWHRLGDTLLMYADDGIVFPKDSSERPNLNDPERGVSENESKSGWVKKDGKWLKPLKFLGLEYIPPTENEEAKLRAKTRNGSVKEFSLDRQLLVYLLNEKELMMWISDGNRQEDEIEVEEEGEEESEEISIFLPKPRHDTMRKSIVYGSKKLGKGRPGSMKLTQLKETYDKVETELESSIGLVNWLKSAGERLSEKIAPLSLLFEGYGLRELADMYNLQDTTASSCKLNCKKGSWLYLHLGEWLYRTIDDFTPSEPLLERIRANSSVWSTETSGLLHTAITTLSSDDMIQREWNSFFKIKGKETAAGYTGWQAELRKEIKQFLKSYRITIYNSSSIAAASLLRSDLKLSPSEIRYCMVNKPSIQESRSELDIKKTEKNRQRKREKEFKQTYRKWPRQLIKVNSELLPNVSSVNV